jgi:hypothetical protein
MLGPRRPGCILRGKIRATEPDKYNVVLVMQELADPEPGGKNEMFHHRKRCAEPYVFWWVQVRISSGTFLN